jgi:hypothetical protein
MHQQRFPSGLYCGKEIKGGKGGKEGPLALIFSSSLNPTLQSLPLSVFSFGKILLAP